MTRAQQFEQTIRSGGVALFPADTVYGLACDPHSAEAIRRLYAIKRRPPDKSAAIMFFDVDAALGVLTDLGQSTAAAMRRLLPGPVTVLLSNPNHRFPLACRADPQVLGVRVITVPALSGVNLPVLQSSANISGGPDVSIPEQLSAMVRAGADLVIEDGPTLGKPSTVIDLTAYERDGSWTVVREGAVRQSAVAASLQRP